MLGDKLRDEIIESQKAQHDLVKWKLILVAAIGATGLRAVPNAPPRAAALLALIPLVCIYVDAACFHCEIRIMTIARFFRLNRIEDLAHNRIYEEFCERHRTHFALIDVALLGVSVILSLLVFVIALSDPMKVLLGVPPHDDAISLGLGASGAFGIVFSLLFYSFCRNRTRWLDDAPIGQKVPNGWRFFFSRQKRHKHETTSAPIRPRTGGTI
jgi:hypothetical protein